MALADPSVDPLTGLPVTPKNTTQPVAGAFPGLAGIGAALGGTAAPSGDLGRLEPGGVTGGGLTSANLVPNAPATPAAPDIFSTIDDLYSKSGIKDGGAGSGFADRAYWAAHPSEVTNGRLAADLAGTGTDQPTGTPGSGIWQNSGAADRAKGSGGASGGSGFWGGANPLTAIQGQLGQLDPSQATDNTDIRNIILSLMQGGGQAAV